MGIALFFQDGHVLKKKNGSHIEEYIAVSQKPLLNNYIVEGLNSQGDRTSFTKLSSHQESTLDCEAWL